MTSSPSGERQSSRLAMTVLGVLGTVAGVTFALYLVGVLFEFRRLKTLGLPADQPVSAMPHDLLLVVGVRSLLVPVGVAIATSAAGFLASVAAPRTSGRSSGTVQRSLAAAVVAGIVVGAIVFVAVPHGGLRVEHVVLAAAGVLVAGAAWFANGRWRWLPRTHLAGLGCMLVVGLAVAYEHAMHSPVHFDYAVVSFVRGPPERGFYIGRDSDEIFLAPSVGATYTCRVLDVISTKDIKRISLRRGKATGGAVADDGKCRRPRLSATKTNASKSLTP